MKQTFPNLASLPTDDLRLIPATERKRGNGIGASPGETPMLPARVAGLARFIGRSYATPAQCEAACPMGQCLPYRGESSPAVACVIRCNRNSDCPAGAGDQRDLPCDPEIHSQVIPPRRSGQGRGSGTIVLCLRGLSMPNRANRSRTESRAVGLPRRSRASTASILATSSTSLPISPCRRSNGCDGA